MPKKVMVAMSGGVDSSVAAVLLLQEGYEVIGATMRLYDINGAESPEIEKARATCLRLGIEHKTLPFQRQFADSVIRPFAEAYFAGKTPNPCIFCNRALKFGAFLQAARAAGCDKIATGHYARIERDRETGRYFLLRSEDRQKDQTYVLYCLTQAQLDRTIFPLGGLKKSQVRALAKKAGIAEALPAESQDICFVPDGDYAGFIERYTGRISAPGDYVGANGEILGRHKGLIHYTIGQRKGLGVAFGRPVFVTEKRPEENTVVLGGPEALLARRVRIGDCNWLPFEWPKSPMQVQAKLRYRQTEQPAVLIPTGQSEAILEFDEPQRAPSPGQAAVCYDGNRLIGGGVILGGMKDA